MKWLFASFSSAKIFHLIGAVVLALASVPEPGGASRLPSGRVVFDSSLELVAASVLEGVEEMPQLKFVLTIPRDAGEPLEALMIRPRNQQVAVVLEPEATAAYISKSPTGSAAIPLASIGGVALNANEMLVVFAAPVEPGSRVTVLLTNHNPQVSGTHEFGVTAYPAGNSPVGQFLGYQLLQF